jgi:hypothetical protein
MLDIAKGVITPLQLLVKAAPSIGAQVGDAPDLVAKSMGAQASGAIGVLGSGVNLIKGLYGMKEAGTDQAERLPGFLSTLGGGIGLTGSIAAAAGGTGAVASLGPVGAAIALGGTVGKYAGEGLWELDKWAHSGAHTEDASDLGSDFVPGVPYDTERSSLFKFLEGDESVGTSRMEDATEHGADFEPGVPYDTDKGVVFDVLDTLFG